MEAGSLFCHIPIVLSILGYSSYGLDLRISQKIIDRSKKYNITNKLSDLSVDRIPFLDNYFDLIIFSETLEHFNFYPLNIFKEFYRILKSDGEIFITTPNLLRLNNRIKMLIGRSVNYNIKIDYSLATHYREYTAKEIKFLLSSSNFKNIKIKYRNFYYPNINKIVNIMNLIIGFIFPNFKSNLIVIGEK